MSSSPIGAGHTSARAGAALVIANARYWTRVAPTVRTELTRWERLAQTIPDRELQRLASSKLREERFNAEMAATLATLAPSSNRIYAIKAIVAVQVMYDYLDVLSEQPSPDPLADGRTLFSALTAALNPRAGPERDYYSHHPRSADGGYLAELIATVRSALQALPATGVVAEVARSAAERCAEAQALHHAARDIGTAQAERWATRQAAGSELGWQEFLAGSAASVLALHALITAAATSATTPAQAARIDAMYLSIGVLTILDSVVDHQRDLVTGERGFMQYYVDTDLLASRLARVAREASLAVWELPNAAHHAMTLVGVVAFYASAPTAGSEPAKSVISRVSVELGPLMGPTLAVMRSWRLAKRARR